VRYVAGNLERFIPNATAPSVAFDIGDATGYTPVLIVFAGTTTGSGSLTVFTTPGDHPNVAASGANTLRSVNRYWTATNNGVAGFTSYDATFNFLASDLDPTADPSNIDVRQFEAGVWTLPLTDNRTATSIRATGMTAFGDFALAEDSPSYLVTMSTLSPDAGTGVPITAQLTSGLGNPVATAGLIVTWSKTGAGGAFSFPTSTTNASGIASIVFTTDPVAGRTYTVTATDQQGVTGTSGSFTSIVGPPGADRTTASVPSNSVVGSPIAVSIQMADRFGNAVAGRAQALTVVLTGANAGATVTSVVDLGNGAYAASYTPTQAGVDTIAILVNGVAIPQSPFVRTILPFAPRLSITTVSSHQNPVVGDTVTITMTVTNSGPAPATLARVTSSIPMQRFVRLSLILSQGSFDEASQVWSIGTIAPLGITTLTFRGIVRIPQTP
jgi:uncharacterized repeat protein (TIGR01451 family)